MYRKAPGIDGISKKCAYILKTPLRHLFLSKHVIPQEWCTHTIAIVPIHKVGDKVQAANYRPISLLSTVSKVLEQLHGL